MNYKLERKLYQKKTTKDGHRVDHFELHPQKVFLWKHNYLYQ